MSATGLLTVTAIPLRCLRDLLRLPDTATPQKIIIAAARETKVCAKEARVGLRNFRRDNVLPDFAERLCYELLVEEQVRNLKNSETN